MSSPRKTQEAQASAPSATPQSQILESPLPAPATDSPTSTKASSALVPPAGGPTSDVKTPFTSTPTSDAASTAIAALPGSTAPGPPTLRPLHGPANEPLQDPVMAKFVSSVGYVVPAPSSSYNVPQQSATSPVLKSTPPMPAASLQPPVPGQPFGNRPSFSYNVFPLANASSASGQQFRPATATNQVQLQGVKLTPPMTAASLQLPVPGQPMRHNPTIPGTFPQNIPRPVGQLSTSSNFSYGESVQSTAADASDKSLTPKDGTSNAVAPDAEIPSVESVKTSSSMPASSSTDSTPSPNPTSSNMLTSISPSFAPHPGMSTISA